MVGERGNLRRGRMENQTQVAASDLRQLLSHKANSIRYILTPSNLPIKRQMHYYSRCYFANLARPDDTEDGKQQSYRTRRKENISCSMKKEQ